MSDKVSFGELWRESMQDFSASFKSADNWLLVAWQEIKARYHRSILGPLWLSANTFVVIVAIGALYSAAWNRPVNEYIPYLASGLVTWGLINGLLTDGLRNFISAASIFQRRAMPYTSVVFQNIVRELMIFAHTVLPFVAVAIYFKADFTPNILTSLGGFLLLFFALSWMPLGLGMLATRYRDVSLVLTQMMTFMVFFTPIFWIYNPEVVTVRSEFVHYNPFYHLISVLRYPLLGQAAEQISYYVTFLIGVFGWIISILMFAIHRRKIIFWL